MGRQTVQETDRLTEDTKRQETDRLTDSAGD